MRHPESSTDSEPPEPPEPPREPPQDSASTGPNTGQDARENADTDRATPGREVTEENSDESGWRPV